MDQRMIDEIAIRDVIARIHMTRSLGKLEDYARHFTPDAKWERLPGPDGSPRVQGFEEEMAHGRENVASGKSGPGSHSHHVIPMTVVDVDGDTAHATSQQILLNGCDGVPSFWKMWILQDDLVRTPDGWKVRHRRFQKP